MNVKITGARLVNIHPNPVIDKVIIQSEKTLGLVELINLSGILLHSRNYDGKYLELEMNKFPSGLYTVRVNGDSFKIIK